MPWPVYLRGDTGGRAMEAGATTRQCRRKTLSVVESVFPLPPPTLARSRTLSPPKLVAVLHVSPFFQRNKGRRKRHTDVLVIRLEFVFKGMETLSSRQWRPRGNPRPPIFRQSNWNSPRKFCDAPSTICWRRKL